MGVTLDGALLIGALVSYARANVKGIVPWGTMLARYGTCCNTIAIVFSLGINIKIFIGHTYFY